MLKEVNGKASSGYADELSKAMQLTGGYLKYLRTNARELVSQVSFPEEAQNQCELFGLFIAYMRARPSEHTEEATREFSPRLIRQMIRLALSMTIVLNKQEVDSHIIERVRKVTMDTARGVSLEVVRLLYESVEGMETRALSIYTSHPESYLRDMLRFLKRIGVLQLVEMKGGKFGNGKRWLLTPLIRKLYQGVFVK